MRPVPVLLLIATCLALAQPIRARTNSAEMANVATTAERAHLILDDALKARNPDTRKLAVQAMSLIGAREPYVSEIKAMLHDDDVQVRVAAIASLLDLRDQNTVSNLREALSDPVPEVSFAAAKALTTLGDDKGRNVLLAVLSGQRDASSGYFTTQGRSALRMFYTPKAVIPYLVGRGVGLAHVAGLGLGIASLEGLLADQNIPGRAAAALMLSNDPDPRVLLAMRQALADNDETVRAAAVHAIALRDDPALEVELRPFLDDKAKAVRMRAAAACLRLELIQPPPPQPAKAKVHR